MINFNYQNNVYLLQAKYNATDDAEYTVLIKATVSFEYSNNVILFLI